MKDIPIKNTGDTYSSSEFNTFYQNSKTPIEDSGQTLNEGDLAQQSKAMAVYASNSTFYTDSGTAGSYILTSIDLLEEPPALKDGLLVRFRPVNTNLIVLAVTSLTRSGSTATVTTTAPHGLLTGGFVLMEGAVEVEYNGIFQIIVTGGSTFTYTVIGTPSTPATGTITGSAGESSVTVGSLASTRITREDGTGTVPNDLQAGIDVVLRYDLSTDAFLLIFSFSIAQFYTDLGTGTPVGEKYEVAPAGERKRPNDYFDGMSVGFRPITSNTIGNPTLQVGTLAAKTITKPDGISNIAVNDIITTLDADFRFDSAHDVFILLNGQSSGFVDFTTFYTDSGTTDVYVLTAAGGLQAPTSYFEGMFVRFRADNNNTGASTANVASLGVKNIKLSDGTTDPPVAFISTETDTYLRFDTANDVLVFSEGFQPATITKKGVNLLFKRILIENSTADVANDIIFQSGSFTFSDGTGSASIITLSKQMNFDFGLGSNAGGMPATVVKTGTFSTTTTTVNGTGTLFLSEFSVGDVIFSLVNNQARNIIQITSDILMTLGFGFSPDVSAETVRKNGLALNTTYHFFALSTPDGSLTDCGFDTSINAANLLADSVVLAAGLTKFRRQGSRFRGIGTNIPMFQIGKSSYFKTRINDVSLTSLVATGTLRTITTPLNLEVNALLYVGLEDGAGTIVIVTSPLEDDIPPTSVLLTLMSTTASAQASVHIELTTNTSSQIRDRADAVSTVDQYVITTLGWNDKQLEN